MKLGILFFVSFFLVAIPAHAETTMYITDNIHVMVRTGPGIDRKIIAMPKTGNRVEVLEELESGWSRVRLSDEKEGWMLSRYLSPGPPSREVIATLKSENEIFKHQVKTLIEENTRFKREQNDLQKALSKQTNTAKTLKRSYETLKSESSEFLSLKASYDKASRDLAARSDRLAELERKLGALQDAQTLRWFVVGAGVLLAGFIVGFIVRRPRRRSSLL